MTYEQIGVCITRSKDRRPAKVFGCMGMYNHHIFRQVVMTHFAHTMIFWPSVETSPQMHKKLPGRLSLFLFRTSQHLVVWFQLASNWLNFLKISEVPGSQVPIARWSWSLLRIRSVPGVPGWRSSRTPATARPTPRTPATPATPRTTPRCLHRCSSYDKWRGTWPVRSPDVRQMYCCRCMIHRRTAAGGEQFLRFWPILWCFFNRCVSDSQIGGDNLGNTKPSRPQPKEYVRDCNLSLSVHATDFDDNFDGERVMNFMGNSRALGHDCYPEVNGCVSNQSRELLFSCIRDRPVSTILTDEGNMLVSAQIAHNVDECPFNGNLLHGVTTIACYVGNLSDLTTTSIGETTTTTSTHWVTAENFEKYPEFVRKWLVEHPGMSLPDESILNMSRVMPVDPVAIGALPFRRNLSAYGAYDSYGPGGLGYGGAYGEENLGAGPGGRGGLRLEGSDGSFNLSTTGFLRCAEKGCKTNMLLDFNRTLVSINKCRAKLSNWTLLQFSSIFTEICGSLGSKTSIFADFHHFSHFVRCTLQLWVNQTDFDNKDGAVEFLTIKVAGNAVPRQCKGYLWMSPSIGSLRVDDSPGKKTKQTK